LRLRLSLDLRAHRLQVRATKLSQVGPIRPEQVEGHIGRRLRAPQEIIELRPSGLVDRDHLAVDYRLVDLE